MPTVVEQEPGTLRVAPDHIHPTGRVQSVPNEIGIPRTKPAGSVVQNGDARRQRGRVLVGVRVTVGVMEGVKVEVGVGVTVTGICTSTIRVTSRVTSWVTARVTWRVTSTVCRTRVGDGTSAGGKQEITR